MKTLLIHYVIFMVSFMFGSMLFATIAAQFDALKKFRRYPQTHESMIYGLLECVDGSVAFISFGYLRVNLATRYLFWYSKKYWEFRIELDKAHDDGKEGDVICKKRKV